jgi:hypothetical protein
MDVDMPDLDRLLAPALTSLKGLDQIKLKPKQLGGIAAVDARVSAQQFPDFRLLSGGFVAPVSALDFPISVSAYRRPVR